MSNPRIALFSLLLLPLIAQAQPTPRYDDPGTAGDRYDERSENVSYDYADVLRVDPVYETYISREPREQCYQTNEYRRSRKDSNANGTIIGAIVGGVLGNTVGKGDGRRAATVAGAVIGGAVGRDVDDKHIAGSSRGYRERGEECQVVEVEREDRRVAGYDVQYRYRGQVYMSRMNFEPGQRLRVRVAIAPIE